MFFAIPFFKNTDFLRQTLQSLLLQTDAEWQAVVLDDSIDIQESLKAKLCVDGLADSRIRYHKNEKNLGMAANWNQAFDLGVHHDLLVILHADDCLKPHYIARMKSLASRHPAAAGFFCKAEIINERGQTVFSMADAYKKYLVPTEEEIILSGIAGIQQLIPGNFIFCPSLCYRMREIGNERFRTDLKMVVDFEFILRFLFKQKTWVGFYGESLFEYRRHATNTTVILTQNLTRFHEEISLYDDVARRLADSGNLKLSAQAKRKTVIKLNLLFQMMKSALRMNFQAFKQECSLLISLF